MVRLLCLGCAVAPVLTGCVARPLEPRDPDPGAFHFTIETYNLNNDEGGDLNTLAAIGQADADVVCLKKSPTRGAAPSRQGTPFGTRTACSRSTRAEARRGSLIFRAFRHRRRLAPRSERMAHGMDHIVDTPTVDSILNAHLRNATGEKWKHDSVVPSTGDDHLYEIKEFTASCTKIMPDHRARRFQRRDERRGRPADTSRQTGIKMSSPLPSRSADLALQGNYRGTIHADSGSPPFRFVVRVAQRMGRERRQF